jgi:hypothetical protein
VNSSLRQADVTAQFGLAPTKNRTHQPDFGRKGMSVEANDRADIARLSSKMDWH